MRSLSRLDVFYRQWHDELTRDVERACDTFAQAMGNAGAVAKTVREARLDVVVLPDVGMSAKSVLLANLRLARAQCAAWGHPVSTGSECVEYFISCEAMEPEDAQAHYSEKLITLPGIGVRYRPAEATGVGDRAQFGLPSDRHVYLCPQSLCKIHPDNDALFIQLVDRDPRALIVFFDGQSTGQTIAFAKRLEQAMRARSVPPRQHIQVPAADGPRAVPRRDDRARRDDRHVALERGQHRWTRFRPRCPS